MSAVDQDLPLAELAESPPGEIYTFAPGSSPTLVSQRGQKIGIVYPVYEGENYLGRSDEKPVDIDLEDQENPEQVWSSRQHAVIRFQDNVMTIEDLNSSNGTYLNRERCYPGKPLHMKPGDVVQIGSIHLRVQE
ncbi:MAG: FHA domain-containing protein [Gemmataceae bacterium]